MTGEQDGNAVPIGHKSNLASQVSSCNKHESILPAHEGVCGSNGNAFKLLSGRQDCSEVHGTLTQVRYCDGVFLFGVLVNFFRRAMYESTKCAIAVFAFVVVPGRVL